MTTPHRIIISRTDSIGDVILALPVAGYLKSVFPAAHIAWLGREYTREVVRCCEHVDYFISYDQFLKDEVEFAGGKPDMIIHLKPEKEIARRAKKLGIRYRVGTSRRVYLVRTCNKLTWLKRKNSGLHEAQLNLKLLKAIDLYPDLNIESIIANYGFSRIPYLETEHNSIIDNNRFNLIIHPKSRGSAREWPIEHFASLINLLPEERFNIMISGVKAEVEDVNKLISLVKRPVKNIAGLLPLDQFIALVAKAEGLITNSTGPIHIAAALGRNAIGLYPPLNGLDPGRWGPLGKHCFIFMNDKPGCTDCKKTKDNCHCMLAIQPVEVADTISRLAENKEPGFSKKFIQ
jgi:ADP-heptose:LPS heptosyltransferase